MHRVRYTITLLLGLTLLTLVPGCTKESQNQLGRSIQNWTGTDGVLDIYAGGQLVMRFIKIDKISTAYGTSDKQPRAYRYGYGCVDENFNFHVDKGEKKVYFEFSDYSTNYIFTRTIRTNSPGLLIRPSELESGASCCCSYRYARGS